MPEAFLDLFSGGNTGKMLVRLVRPEASAFARAPIRARSSTKRAYSASRSSRTRSRKLGWTVTQASPPSGKRVRAAAQR